MATASYDHHGGFRVLFQIAEKTPGHGRVPDQLGLAEPGEIQTPVAMHSKRAPDEGQIFGVHPTSDHGQVATLFRGERFKALAGNLFRYLRGYVEPNHGDLVFSGIKEYVFIKGPRIIPVIVVDLFKFFLT